MLNRILDGLAMGLSLIVGTSLAMRYRWRLAGRQGDAALQFPLERLDRLEARLAAIETRTAPAGTGSAAAGALDLRVARQEDIETLQSRLGETAARMESRFAEMTREVPLILESAIRPQIDEIRARLQAETLESVAIALKAFEQTFETGISAGMVALERALIGHSEAIAASSQRESESAAYVQRIAAAVDRLCQQANVAGPAPRQEPVAALARPVPSPVVWPDSGFRPRIVKEEDEKPRPRKPLTRI